MDLFRPCLAQPGSDCPNSNPALSGKIGFWLAMPGTVEGVVIFMHGITDVKEDMFAVMNTLTSKKLSNSCNGYLGSW